MIGTIAAKELKALFASPLAWVTLGLLQAVLAWLFLARLDAFLAVQPRLAQLANPPGITELIVAPMFSTAALVLLMAAPMLSMRLFADERRNQTLTLLMSAPLTMRQIVLGKFLGLTAFLWIIVAACVLLALSLLAGGNLDYGLLAANCAGLALLCAAYAALGLFISSLTSHLVVAAIGTLAALLGSWLIGINVAERDAPLTLLSLARHFESFNKGVIDSADVVWFALFIATFLALAVRRLDRDRLFG
ncbi:MAG TPA: ABC transporter permease subunit [Burkholderiales bacterium]|nr:ABC transporter permease subunit [Burkholderiales bacterium]